MNITKADFDRYEAARLSGVTNMYDTRAVEERSGLMREQIFDIMKNYSDYKQEFYHRSPVAKRMEEMKRVGTMVVDYKNIVKEFGEPYVAPISCKESDVVWIVNTLSEVAIIYNYKNGRRYLHDKGLDIFDITEWTIGGKDRSGDACDYVRYRLGDKAKDGAF